MIATNHSHPTCRLIDKWDGGTTRPGAEVVAELYARAPDRVRRLVRALTRSEERLWKILANRARMGVEVFPQVPIHLPEDDLGYVMTFFLPRFAARIEPSDVNWRSDNMDAIRDQFMAECCEDDALREVGGIVTIRFPREAIAAKPAEIADYLRWELGLSEKAPRGMGAVAVPR